MHCSYGSERAGPTALVDGTRMRCLSTRIKHETRKLLTNGLLVDPTGLPFDFEAGLWSVGQIPVTEIQVRVAAPSPAQAMELFERGTVSVALRHGDEVFWEFDARVADCRMDDGQPVLTLEAYAEGPVQYCGREETQAEKR